MEIPDSVQVVSDKYLQNISDAFKTLYNEEQLSDVTIYCKEGSLKAHKLILAASSPYFCKIFRENRNEFPILILHGTSMNQMKNLIDLLYTGITDVRNDDVEALNRLIREFEIKGVNFGQGTLSSNIRLDINGSNVSPDSIHNRDTRFKGRKRVAVDYEQEENLQNDLPSTSRIDTGENHPAKRSNSDNDHNEELNEIKMEACSPVPTESTIFSLCDVTSISDRSSYTSNSSNKISAWAKKQRKFKCHLCPSSFKRSSHLSRHQLVHTGERPYSCNRCDKAFSRVDKLKHHIRKSHEFIPDSMYERIDDINDSESEPSLRIQTSPHQNSAENVYTTGYVDLPAPKNSGGNSPPLFTISHISTVLEDSFVSPTKKGRGRPRKYPLSTASPTVLNSNKEHPISNCIKVKKKRKSWMDLFKSENENKRTSMRLREKTQKNKNEDSTFSETEYKSKKNLMCEICDQPYIYEGKLKTHMKKIHNISYFTVNERRKNSMNTEPRNDKEGKEATLAISSVYSLQNVNSNTGLEDYDGKNDEVNISNSIKSNPDSKKGNKITEHLSYEQLRRLIPKECSLKPIVLSNDNSTSENKNVSVSSSIDQNVEGSDVTSNTLSKSISCSNIDKIDLSQAVIKSTKTQNKLEGKKTKHTKARKQKLKHVPNFPKQSETISCDEESSPSKEDSNLTSLSIPRSNSAIEISLISTKDIDTSPILSQNDEVVIIDTSEKCQQGKIIRNVDVSHDSTKGSNIAIKELKSFNPETSHQGNKTTNNSKEFELSPHSELQSSEIPQKKKRGRPRKSVEGNSEQETGSPLKKRRGEARKKSKVLPSVKRGRGRPRGQVFSTRPTIQNYNLSNLPYGDLNYLTGQSDMVDDEEGSPVIMEPLVEINMDQNEQKEDEIVKTDKEPEKKNPIEITRILNSSSTKTVVNVLDESVKEEKNKDGKSEENIDISEIENKIGLIGECTISVAN